MLENGASIVNDPVRGNVLNLLTLATQYVNLPAGAGAAQTVSGWVKWNGGNEWQRIFDFGQSTSQYFFLTTADSSNLPQCAITPQSSVYVQTIESPVPIATGQWNHIAVVLDGREGILYLNGNAVAVNNGVNLLPSDIGSTDCYFGKSQFPSDPTFNGRLSAMRLDSSAEPLAQIIAPVPAITQPTNGTLFAGGWLLDFAGAATDYSGALLSSNAYSWTGELHSNGVTYAVFGPLTGIASGTYLVPTNVATTTNIFYQINLAVTDTNGYQQTVSGDVQPQTAELTFGTVPAGLQLVLDGQPLTTPASLAAVVGISRNVSAPSPQSLSGSNYQFVVWSDGGASAHAITVPPTNTTFTASFLQPGIGISAGAGRLNLNWPQWAGAMNLYSATNLSPPVVWSPVAVTPSVSNGWMSVQVPVSNGNCFYRLQLP